MTSEFEEVMDVLPNVKNSGNVCSGPNNAFVAKDEFGRVSILIDGVWLGAKISDFEVDQAPFCG